LRVFEHYKKEIERIKKFRSHDDRSILNSIAQQKAKLKTRLEEIKSELLTEDDQDTKKMEE
jgi:hypothetical protein